MEGKRISEWYCEQAFTLTTDYPMFYNPIDTKSPNTASLNSLRNNNLKLVVRSEPQIKSPYLTLILLIYLLSEALDF